MTHSELCERAIAWLEGSRRCTVVLCGNASTREIPDAIGWRTGYVKHGSVVIECKTSRSDFMKDKNKYLVWRSPRRSWEIPFRTARMSKEEADAGGYLLERLPCMGSYRYFLSRPEIISPEDVRKHYPDHGLLHAMGGRCREVLEAPKRKTSDSESEIRCLVFALRHLQDRLKTQGIPFSLRMTLHPLTSDKGKPNGEIEGNQKIL